MSQSTEQNLNEFIKSLREVTEKEPEKDAIHTQDRISGSTENVSDEDLQNRLKSLYQTSDVLTLENEEENAYALDESFLQEVTSEESKEVELGSGNVPKEEAELTISKLDETGSDEEKFEMFDLLSEEQAEEKGQSNETAPLLNEVENGTKENDLPPWEDIPDTIIVASDDHLKNEEVVSFKEKITEADQDLPVDGLLGDITDEDLVGEDFSMEDLLSDRVTEEIDSDENSTFEFKRFYEEMNALRNETWSNRELESEMNISSEKTNEDVEITDAENKTAIELDDDQEALSETIAMEEKLTETVSEEEFDLATVDLMLQLGCNDELKKSFGESKVQTMLSKQYEDDIPLDMRSYVRDGDEETEPEIDVERLTKIREGYSARRIRIILRLIGASVLTFFLMLFEVLPFFGVEYNGVLDYHEYPKAYLLFCLQLFVLTMACSWKELWISLKKTFFLRPDRYSAVIFAMIAIVFYDVVLLSSALVEMPEMFHFAGACILLVTQVSEYMMLLCEMKNCSLFFADHRKYTLANVSEDHPLAEQMSSDDGKVLSIYAPRHFKIPRGYFRAVADRDEHKMYYSSFVAFVLSMILCVISIVLKAEAIVSFRIALMTLLAMLPLSAVFQFAYPLFVASGRLGKRECAVAGASSVLHYADTQVMLLRDLHLFEKCHAQNAGIAFYCENQTEKTIAALHALYSAIGGPMEGIFEEFAPHLRAENIRIHRIARNGIEALIDDRHVLLVGEADFMKRYGLAFPKNDTETGTGSTLCVSLDHEVTAKISVRYTVLPVFDMLVDRMAHEGIRCVIETYDPLINSTMVARLRGNASTSVSVLHKNASDFNDRAQRHFPTNETTGIVAGTSRLKLVETVIWCCRLRKIDRWSKVLSGLFSGIALFFAVLCTALLTVDNGEAGLMSFNQVTLVLYEILALLSGILLTHWMLPKRNYFVTDSYLQERDREALKNYVPKETQKKRKKK